MIFTTLHTGATGPDAMDPLAERAAAERAASLTGCGTAETLGARIVRLAAMAARLGTAVDGGCSGAPGATEEAQR